MRWIRYSSAKVPLRADGSGVASLADSSHWVGIAAAARSRVGAGMSFVLGDGFACIDLDDCVRDGVASDAAMDFMVKYPSNYIEVSPSGNGLHIWGTAPEALGYRRKLGELSLERYSRGRQITVTGQVFQPGALLPL